MAGSRNTRAEAGEVAVVRAVSERRLDAVVVRKERRSSVMESLVDWITGDWGVVKAEALARMARRAVLRKDFMVLICLSLLVL